jgi:hypothetical protein
MYAVRAKVTPQEIFLEKVEGPSRGIGRSFHVVDALNGNVINARPSCNSQEALGKTTLSTVPAILSIKQCLRPTLTRFEARKLRLAVSKK